MNRRGFFRLLAGVAAWAATQHVAWAFPEPVHVWPRALTIEMLEAVFRKVEQAPPHPDLYVLHVTMRATYERLLSGKD